MKSRLIEKTRSVYQSNDERINWPIYSFVW